VIRKEIGTEGPLPINANEPNAVKLCPVVSASPSGEQSMTGKSMSLINTMDWTARGVLASLAMYLPCYARLRRSGISFGHR
jgi:hypothetical protein